MYCTRKVTADLTWVGGNDKNLSMFEGSYPVPDGISYNSYILTDEKTVLFDAVDHACAKVFTENVLHTLNGRQLDYLVIHHMEPDHSATIGKIIEMYPQAEIICTSKTKAMMKQFFNVADEIKITEVKEGDSISTGRHNLNFIMAPMVHWPEVMMTYDATDKILFSADAFGSFGTLDGAVTDKESEPDINESRRYYTNIVGKYGSQVKAVLEKASSLDIQMICPLHGLILTESIPFYINKYSLWSSYIPEEKGVLIVYSSVYGNTENAVNILSCKLREKGIKVKMYNTSVTHDSYIISDAFRYSNIVIGTTTYNSGIFVSMENFLNELTAHNIKNRKISVIENGSWAPVCGKLVKAKFEKSKDIEFIGDTVTVKSSANEESFASIEKLAEEIADSIS